MEGAIFKASWPAGPDVLVLPERDGSTSARDLVIQALSATMLLADRQLPQAVVLASGPWNLKARELRAIAETMAEKGVTLVGLCSRDPLTRVAAAAIGLNTSTPLPEREVPVETEAIPPSLTVHQGMVRSGDHLESKGSLLILGDVNPGGRVTARGHVMVWGRLRGIAHAGCLGDSSMRIVALQLCPLQLRIANVVARGPEELPSAGLAEQAVLVDGAIRLEAAAPVWPLLT
jgi:septum site-determining protein MinC